MYVCMYVCVARAAEDVGERKFPVGIHKYGGAKLGSWECSIHSKALDKGTGGITCARSLELFGGYFCGEGMMLFLGIPCYPVNRCSVEMRARWQFLCLGGFVTRWASFCRFGPFFVILRPFSLDITA